MIDPGSGRAPNLGANDGALLLPLSSSAFDDYRPTVQAAARAFLRLGLPPGKWDELSIWLGLRATARTARLRCLHGRALAREEFVGLSAGVSL